MSEVQKISALYVRSDSIYKALGLDCWDKERDARNWHGFNPVIAHPPCGHWGRLRRFCKQPIEEKELALIAVKQVRLWGGVLEHPAGSKLWNEMSLPRPGLPIMDEYGGYSISVDQFWFGHKAKKNTWLYIVGCDPKKVPPVQLKLDAICHVVGTTIRSGKPGYRPQLSTKEREATPLAFAEFLIDIARKCK